MNTSERSGYNVFEKLSSLKESNQFCFQWRVLFESGAGTFDHTYSGIMSVKYKLDCAAIAFFTFH